MGKPFRSARKVALAVVSTLVFSAGAARAQDQVAPRFAVSFAKARSANRLMGACCCCCRPMNPMNHACKSMTRHGRKWSLGLTWTD